MTGKEESNDSGMLERSPSRGTHGRWWICLLVICLMGFAAYVYVAKTGNAAVSAGKRGAGARTQVVPVVTAVARQGEIGSYLNGLGSVTPLNTVSVKSRVDGQLMKIHYQEGQLVDKGYLLAEIDPRPYEVMLAQAEGQMARDQALLKNAQLDVKRYELLVKQDSIPKQQLDTQKALVQQYEGTVKADQAQIDNAKLQLAYSRIIAPITGRIGLRQVDPGNIVHAADTNGLAVITQLQPISVIFTIAEDSLPPVLAKLKAGEKLQVEAFDRDEVHLLSTGYLLTLDNQIDQNTGTVRLKAVFDNKESELFPNQFVNARLLLDVKRGATLIPSAALQRSPQGTYVYTVRQDQTIAMRPVKVGVAQADEVSIDEGISPGDIVVVDGAERLREGSKVQVQASEGGASPRSDG